VRQLLLLLGRETTRQWRPAILPGRRLMIGIAEWRLIGMRRRRRARSHGGRQIARGVSRAKRRGSSRRCHERRLRVGRERRRVVVPRSLGPIFGRRGAGGGLLRGVMRLNQVRRVEGTSARHGGRHVPRRLMRPREQQRGTALARVPLPLSLSLVPLLPIHRRSHGRSIRAKGTSGRGPRSGRRQRGRRHSRRRRGARGRERALNRIWNCGLVEQQAIRVHS